MNVEKRKALIGLSDALSAAYKVHLFDDEILDNAHPDTINGFVDAVRFVVATQVADLTEQLACPGMAAPVKASK